MKNRLRKRILTSLGFLGIFVWIVSPICIITVLSIAASTATFAPSRPVFVHPERNDDTIARPVQIGLQWGSNTSLVAPSWGGLVQEVLVKPTTKVDDGSPVLRIDGIVRTAAVTPWPFARPLSPGDTGEDVKQLQLFLNARGSISPVTSVMDAGTMDALRTWAGTIGVPNASSVGAFDPSWLVYLPRPSFALSIDIVVGAPAPPPGAPIVELMPPLLDAVLLDATTSAQAEESPNMEAVTPTATALPSEQLVYADAAIELDDSAQRASAAGLSTLSSLLMQASSQVAGVLTQPSSASYWRVPAPAVVLTPGSAACVFVSDDGGAPKAVDVTVIASTGGEIVIDARLDAKQDLAVFSTGESRACP